MFTLLRYLNLSLITIKLSTNEYLSDFCVKCKQNLIYKLSWTFSHFIMIAITSFIAGCKLFLKIFPSFLWLHTIENWNLLYVIKPKVKSIIRRMEKTQMIDMFFFCFTSFLIQKSNYFRSYDWIIFKKKELTTTLSRKYIG